jgi:hypothetical protein
MKDNPLSLIVVPLLAGFALLQPAQAVSPPPDGGYPNFTTAEGDNALKALTIGTGNTAVGTFSLFSVTTGNFNTAVGAGSLDLNQADFNTATGAAALLFNTTGTLNTAVGTAALEFNDTGSNNTADGAFALFSNTTAERNTATGYQALFSTTSGSSNTANGAGALFSNTTGQSNTASGESALYWNTVGYFNTALGNGAISNNVQGVQNTAVGSAALASNVGGDSNIAVGVAALASNDTGSGNIGIGVFAGSNLTTGSHNIDIDNDGVEGESGTIRIGQNQFHQATYLAGVAGQVVGLGGSTCYVDNDGKLGVFLSARRYKENIQQMDDESGAVYALKPVTFRYKREFDKSGTPQFGLIAEEVAAVNPDLVTCNAKGEMSTVRYEAVNAMLLNEFLKEHRKVEALEATVAQQHKDFETAVAELKGQIQKVSAQLEVSKPAPQTVLNHH